MTPPNSFGHTRVAEWPPAGRHLNIYIQHRNTGAMTGPTQIADDRTARAESMAKAREAAARVMDVDVADVHVRWIDASPDRTRHTDTWLAAQWDGRRAITVQQITRDDDNNPVWSARRGHTRHFDHDLGLGEAAIEAKGLIAQALAGLLQDAPYRPTPR
ncbi:hypothetical protein [Actinomadura fulvescens]|uniref:hypothetical protein n=1 Tax=Actinomadura fulvescens TaxID=46160 RepID=UPI0031D3E5F1